ncbi:Extracellular calcium-sensing receptor [Collichthys lucidus]|uniref:Extracellular calcium-sensing receptor n=1 Tax=Collichthys lucidus TaxID=240159 RepID=A0A4U5V071_COLLU|nr:Extracellular calcium-sensing receptor [Collichthys lucidus]
MISTNIWARARKNTKHSAIRRLKLISTGDVSTVEDPESDSDLYCTSDSVQTRKHPRLKRLKKLVDAADSDDMNQGKLPNMSNFDHRAFRWMMTMVFAVEEINRNSTLLPGVRLGYRIMDSCDNVHTSLQALFSLVSHSKAVVSEMKDLKNTEKEVKTDKIRQKNRVKSRGNRISTEMPHSLKNNGNYTEENETDTRKDRSTRYETLSSCLADSPVPAVIGLASSSPTRAVAHTLGPLNLPLVSYFATCTCLTDKNMYPSFLRTVPSDLFQVRGLVQLVTFLGWLWVGTIGTTDDYSHYGIQAFSNQFKQQGGCLAFHLTIPKSPTESQIQEMADRLHSSTAQVVVVFATEGQLLDLLLEKCLFRFVNVGSYDGSAPLGQQLQMKLNTIVWTEGQSQTIVVLLAFRSNVPGSRALKLFGPSQQRTLILCTTAPQILISKPCLLIDRNPRSFTSK